jgi:CheY-specific phosphatase CheX
MLVDNQALSDNTRLVIEDVLETMFFSTAVAVDCRHEPGSIAARLRFTGDPSGDFELTLSSGVARQFACSFLAVDEPDLPSSAESEVACELANMICGAALSRIHPDSIVKLSAPALADPASPLAGAHQCFETPEGVLSVTLRVD